MEVSERFSHLNPSSPIYSNRFPLWKSAFQLNSLQEEIELIQGLQKSFDSIYKLDVNGEFGRKKKEVGIYVEIKEVRKLELF
jgi:hypothetical protein